jgi:hypothetical protein
MKNKLLNNSVLYINQNKTKAGLYGLAFVLIVIFIFVLSKKRNAVSVAKKFLGQEETSPNKGFKDKGFESLMKNAGWYVGAQWCAFFARLIWLKSLKGKRLEVANKLLSGSSQQTYLNFKNDNSGLFKTSQTPKVGSIVIWQSTKDSARGHAGIVKKVTANGFETIEGNSNTDGSPGKVANLVYKTGQYPKYLKLRGFINIA